MKSHVTKLLLSASLTALFYTVSSLESHSKPGIKYSHSMLSNVLNIKNPAYLNEAAKQSFSKLAHSSGTHSETKRSAFDSLDFESILNDPSLMDLVNELEHESEPEVTLDHVMQDDYLSNVIPGAMGPYDFFPPSPPYMPNHVPEHMIDEFMYYLSLKESGRLDKCMPYR